MERWVGSYFTEWIDEAQRLEKERMKSTEVTSHPGFGRQGEIEAGHWVQWFEHVDGLNARDDEDSDDSDPEVEEEHIVPDEDEDED